MGSDLNNVVVTLSVAGQACNNYVSIVLEQRFNAHHRLEAVVNYEELDKLWFDNPEKMINMIGKTVDVTMKHKQTGEENIFSGIITETEITGQHGQQGNIVIRGCSPTILLEGCRNMDSFMDKTLKLIVDEVAGEQGNGASITCRPAYTSKIDFICQHDESAFEFLNRLSYLYGEYFYYDGQQIYFGNPYKTASAAITYDVHLQDIHFYSTLIPSKQDQYHYLNHDDKEIDSPASKVDSTPYAKLAMGRSEAVYSAKTMVPVKANILTKKGLDDMVMVEKTRQLGRMHCVRGNSQTCRVKIGEGIGVKLPATMKVFKNVGDFIVTEVTHYVGTDGRYHNEFKGLPKQIENIPVDNIRIPVAGPQIATVKTNDDERKLGRIKVQLQWQKKKGKTTNWIRVQTPNAGKSDDVAKNRGFVFIPEKDDIVMVGFEYGDPNLPFVMGSIFSEKVSQGCGPENNTKTLITRSGHTIKMDDTEGKEKIQIYDIKGNIVEIDTVDNTINISANETINLNAININLLAKNAITATAGVNFAASAGATSSVTGGISTFINAGKDAAIKAGKTLSAKGGKNALISSGLNAQMTLDSKGNTTIKGKKKVDVSSKNKVLITGTKQTLVTGKKTKVQGSSKMDIKGSKVHVG